MLSVQQFMQLPSPALERIGLFSGYAVGVWLSRGGRKVQEGTLGGSNAAKWGTVTGDDYTADDGAEARMQSFVVSNMCVFLQKRAPSEEPLQPWVVAAAPGGVPTATSRTAWKRMPLEPAVSDALATLSRTGCSSCVWDPTCPGCLIVASQIDDGCKWGVAVTWVDTWGGPPRKARQLLLAEGSDMFGDVADFRGSADAVHAGGRRMSLSLSLGGDELLLWSHSQSPRCIVRISVATRRELGRYVAECGWEPHEGRLDPAGRMVMGPRGSGMMCSPESQGPLLPLLPVAVNDVRSQWLCVGRGGLVVAAALHRVDVDPTKAASLSEYRYVDLRDIHNSVDATVRWLVWAHPLSLGGGRTLMWTNTGDLAIVRCAVPPGGGRVTAVIESSRQLRMERPAVSLEGIGCGERPGSCTLLLDDLSKYNVVFASEGRLDVQRRAHGSSTRESKSRLCADVVRPSTLFRAVRAEIERRKEERYSQHLRALASAHAPASATDTAPAPATVTTRVPVTDTAPAPASARSLVDLVTPPSSPCLAPADSAAAAAKLGDPLPGPRE